MSTVPESPQEQITRFENLDKVVVDDLRFKLKLGIGSDAYTSLKYGKRLQELWDVGGVAASGAGLAASSTVASTFFSSSGIMAAIGLGSAAVTPVGWIIAAATTSGAAYYGVTRLFRNFSVGRVHTIPAFINTPIDLLAANLVDLIAPLAVKVAQMDNDYDPREREVIKDYFVTDWGISAEYLDAALLTIEENTTDNSLSELVKSLADFKKNNPDCNYDHIRSGLLSFLKEVALADNRMDEREDMALERIDNLLKSQGRFSFSDFLPTLR